MPSKSELTDNVVLDFFFRGRVRRDALTNRFEQSGFSHAIALLSFARILQTLSPPVQEPLLLHGSRFVCSVRLVESVSDRRAGRQHASDGRVRRVCGRAPAGAGQVLHGGRQAGRGPRYGFQAQQQGRAGQRGQRVERNTRGGYGVYDMRTYCCTRRMVERAGTIREQRVRNPDMSAVRLTS